MRRDPPPHGATDRSNLPWANCPKTNGAGTAGRDVLRRFQTLMSFSFANTLGPETVDPWFVNRRTDRISTAFDVGAICVGAVSRTGRNPAPSRQAARSSHGALTGEIAPDSNILHPLENAPVRGPPDPDGPRVSPPVELTA